MNSKPVITITDKEWDALLQAHTLPYILALTGQEDPLNAKVHFQTFDDAYKSGDPKYRPHLARSRYGSLKDLGKSLREANRAGAGIFVAVNETDGIKRSVETIVRVRAVWAEFDGPQIDLSTLPLAPSIVVQSHHGPHLYWMVEPGVSPEDCRAAVKAIAHHLNGDPKVHDPSRVLRVPGFFHLKNPDAPFLVTLVKS